MTQITRFGDSVIHSYFHASTISGALCSRASFLILWEI